MRKLSRLYPVFIFLFTLSLFLGLGEVSADSNTKQRVFDDANLLEGNDLLHLETTAEEYSVENKTDFIILTIDENFTPNELKKYVQDMYDEEAYGFDKNHGNAVILALDIASREVYIAGFDEAEKYLDDNRIELVLDHMISDLNIDNFDAVFDTFIVVSSQYLKYSAGINPESIFLKSSFQLIVALIIAGAIVGTMAYNSSGKVTINASTYLDAQKTKIRKRRDRYIRTTVTKTRKPKNKSSGGGGGRGGGTTGGGRSHSGGGRSF